MNDMVMIGILLFLFLLAAMYRFLKKGKRTTKRMNARDSYRFMRDLIENGNMTFMN